MWNWRLEGGDTEMCNTVVPFVSLGGTLKARAGIGEIAVATGGFTRIMRLLG